MPSVRLTFSLSLVLTSFCYSAETLAQADTTGATSEPTVDAQTAVAGSPATMTEEENKAPPPPPPYSLPWQLRSVVPATVVRSDTAFAFYETADGSKSGSTIATTLLGSYKITPEFAALVRLGLVHNSPPDITTTPPAPPAPGSATSFMNPVLGALYGMKPSPDLRLGVFLGVAVPIGGGGGNSPDGSTRAAMIPAGIYARSAMDNAMFAMNYLTVFPGVGFAYVAHGFTAQVEVTLLELIRVRGDQVDKESTRTNFTTGLHLGYFFIPQLSIGGEIRHQRWLSTPANVEKDESLRDTTTFAIGPRLHFKLSDTMWFRPGIAYARGLDKPMTTGSYNIVQLDLPLVF